MFKLLKEKLNKFFKKEEGKEKEKQEILKIDEEELPKEIEKEIDKIKEKKSEREEKIKETLEKEKKESFFQKITKGLTTMKLSEAAFNDFFKELEEILIENNVAIEVIEAIRVNLKNELLGREIIKTEAREKIKEALKKSISSLMKDPFDVFEKIKEKKEKPFVIVFFGINGSGKTTTIAKMAYLLKSKKLGSVFAASDTFRAASIEQLEKHANKLQIKVIKHKYGADPAAVAFDAIAHAKAHKLDVVLVDTAGRMHTKADLLREMEKICRVAKPDLKIFVGEAITGNDAVEQARTFNQTVGIDAIILTKADVDERGGAIISVSYATEKPIIFLGTGQEYTDLEMFDKNKIIEKIF
ncbi:MAG: signal recognition particle-docking protein FtsY [Candidatus Pacearchaeota archaeon]